MQVRVSLGINRVLIGLLAVLRIDGIDHVVQTIAKYNTEGRKALTVQTTIVTIIDKQLGCPRVGASSRVTQRACGIAGDDRVVENLQCSGTTTVKNNKEKKNVGIEGTTIPETIPSYFARQQRHWCCRKYQTGQQNQEPGRI